ncbi:hypothetical protein HK44_013055 [Pseudomonas fluorescens HK44]|uniref:Uncharacterized protein n=1 Tax=Pseudomonas fluorescens HK44 TaxID=1042209 RepID=A0A010SGF6_PSEFL|nr:hypothetical protein HK44_013055 [Pseudomonas fluorescens HK44]
MASHDETTVSAASLYDGKATDRVGICRPSSIVFLPVCVLVLVVSFAEFQNNPAEPWTIVTRGILNTSVEHS